MRICLAVDIGASSGRHIAGWREGGRLVWDVDELLRHVREGIGRALEAYPDIASFSIDTRGVDYVLLRGDAPVTPVYAYRDSRTEA